MKITPEVIDKIVECLNENVGRPAHICAQKIGVNPSQFKRLMKSGADPDCDDPLAVRLYTDVSKASANTQIKIIDSMVPFMESDWRASDRLLKIVNPEFDEKKTTQRVEVSGELNTHHTQRYEVGVGEIGEILGVLRDFVGSRAIVGAAGELAAAFRDSDGSTEDESIIDVETEMV